MSSIFREIRRVRRSILSTILMLTALAWAGSTVQRVRAADAETLATAAELHKMFDGGEFQPLLAKVTRVLQLKGDAALPYDHVDLATLKANTLLEMKQQASAIASLNEAIKAITDQTDPKFAIQARATLILVKRSQAFGYAPKTPPAKPIGILDMAQRKAAYTALLADLHAEVTAKAKAAKAGKSLPPIIEAVRSISDMRSVEMMARDSDTESMQFADDLATQAKTLMTDAVQTMSKRGGEIDAEANAYLAPPTRTTAARMKGSSSNTDPVNRQKFGLTSKMINELKQIIDNSTKVASVAKDFEEVSKQNAAGFKEITEIADRAAKAASVTLSADYSSKK